MSRTLTQEIAFDSTPDKIYAALTQSSQFSQVTGGKKTEIDLTEGGKISMFDGIITGYTVEAVENLRLVQVWRAGNWPEGVYSLVKFELKSKESGSTLQFEQTGFPDGEKDHLEGGWHKMYWEPIKAFLS